MKLLIRFVKVGGAGELHVLQCLRDRCFDVAQLGVARQRRLLSNGGGNVVTKGAWHGQHSTHTTFAELGAIIDRQRRGVPSALSTTLDLNDESLYLVYLASSTLLKRGEIAAVERRLQRSRPNVHSAKRSTLVGRRFSSRRRTPKSLGTWAIE
uniref:Uncharacterized protein n=1 Tax=Plectus sambesii TaxID=2011161 RepID=A0A914X5V3_9BILA